MPGAELVVDVLDPPVGAPTLGEPVADSEPPSQLGEDVVVVSGLGHRFDRLLHPEDEVVIAGPADVVSLQWGGGGEHDVAVAGQGVPERLVADGGVRGLPGPGQPVQILMMMERVPTRPVDESGVGVGVTAAVVVELLAAM